MSPVVHRPGHRANHDVKQGAETERLSPRDDLQAHTCRDQAGKAVIVHVVDVQQLT